MAEDPTRRQGRHAASCRWRILLAQQRMARAVILGLRRTTASVARRYRGFATQGPGVWPSDCFDRRGKPFEGGGGLGGLFPSRIKFRVRHRGWNRVASCHGIGSSRQRKTSPGHIPFIYIATVVRALASRLATMSFVVATPFLK